MRFRVGAMLVAVLAVTAIPTFAQVTGAVKVGATFSKITLEEDGATGTFSSDMKSGLVVGAAVDVPITELFSFQPEFLYVMKGGKNGDLNEGADFDVKVKVGMFQIPLLFKANFAGGSARPFVVFGPALGFVTSAKIEFDVEGIDDEDIKDDLETVEFSGVVGVGLQFGRGTIEYRYDHGFNDLDKEDGSSAKSRTHAILFGFGFGG